jgi:hypothetical protein
MKHKRAIAACTLIALGVGATSATAGSLITSANIKDGTIHMRDLAPSLQKKIERAGKPGPQGANGANGVNGAKGQDGVNGIPGRDGNVRYDRVADTCTPGTAKGTTALAGGVMRLGVPHQMAYTGARACAR